MFIDIREAGSERERERERERWRKINMREKHQLVASHMCPKWGVEPTNFWCTG